MAAVIHGLISGVLPARCQREAGACGAGAAGSESQPYMEGAGSGDPAYRGRLARKGGPTWRVASRRWIYLGGGWAVPDACGLGLGRTVGHGPYRGGPCGSGPYWGGAGMGCSGAPARETRPTGGGWVGEAALRGGRHRGGGFILGVVGRCPMPADWVWGGPWDTVPTGVVPAGVAYFGEDRGTRSLPGWSLPEWALLGRRGDGLLGGAGSGDPTYRGRLARKGGPTCEPETETTTGDWQVVGSGSPPTGVPDSLHQTFDQWQPGFEMVGFGDELLDALLADGELRPREFA